MLRLLAKGSVINGERISTGLDAVDNAKRTVVSKDTAENMSAGMCPDASNAAQEAGFNNQLSFYVKIHEEMVQF